MNHTILLEKLNMELIRQLSQKPGQEVMQVRQSDGSGAVLRIYDEPMDIYRLLAGHECQQLPQIYAAGKYREKFYVIEEYIDGVSLQEMLDGGARMSIERTIELTCKICAAAAFLHSKGFIHRDIKPEHVLLASDGRVVLIDLDASMRILSDKKNDTQLLGTAMYAAPEQFGLSRSDERTDVYAMGILMNELLTGVHPAVTRYQGGPLAEIIERCIRMNPAERYQSAAELELVLKTLQMPRIRKKRKPALLLAGVILCIVIGLLALVPPQNEIPTGEYLPMYGDMSHQYDLYYNFRFGTQSRSLYTEENVLIDETWDVYADPQVGVIEEWNTMYEGWCLNSERCNVGETGYIHAEKNGKHYVIPVQVQGEPMSAYSEVPDSRRLAEGYLQPEEEAGIPYPGVVNVPYKPGEDMTIYLAAMEGFYNLQPVCDSSLVTIEPCEADHWNLPVFAMTFRNPEGGDIQLEVGSNHNSLQFRFIEN